MPTERLAMRHVRDVIRLKSAGMPTREIARRVRGEPWPSIPYRECQYGRRRRFSGRDSWRKSPVFAGFFCFGSGRPNRARGRFFCELAVFLRTSGLRGFSTVLKKL